MDKNKPVKEIREDGSVWYYCPICKAGWRQFVNYVDGYAFNWAKKCIENHRKSHQNRRIE